MQLYASLYDRLRNQHEALRHIIAPVDASRLSMSPQGKWSIHDNIAHLAKYQPVFLERMQTILQTEEPVFERYKAENDPLFEEWRQWSTNKLLSALDRDREDIVHFIMMLSDTERLRVGMPVRFGRLTILEWTEFFLLHEAHHLFTIFQLVHDPDLREQP